jgi:hypothetical protein
MSAITGLAKARVDQADYGIVKNEPTLFKRPYLLNTETLDLIPVQNNAWNDMTLQVFNVD